MLGRKLRKPLFFLWLWIHTCTCTPFFYSFTMSFVFWRLSLPVFVILPILSSPQSPIHPGTDSVEPISSWSCLLFAPVNSASQEWPPLFIEGLFIWTTWLLCPNPEITFGSLWKGWWVSVIWCCLFILGRYPWPLVILFCFFGFRQGSVKV